MAKQLQFIIKGMSQDIDIQKSNTEFSYENHNIRITAREDSNLISVTNERGNKELELNIPIKGIVLGHCVLNNYITLFAKDKDIDYIYRIEYTDTEDIENKILFSGNLNFDTKYPIQTLGSYENDNIQKVYWIDGLNQPRFINIVADNDTIDNWNKNPTLFDFIPTLALKEDVTIIRDTKSSGMFASGVIQYAFTYINLYGQESNIFYCSPLYYISFNNRGASPENKVNMCFHITIEDYDNKFNTIRVYSIHRTSINAIPEVKRVTDIDLPKDGKSVTYTDDGTHGDIEDPTKLLYVGGEEIVPYAMSQKDNTLFFGNIKLNRRLINEDIRNFFKSKSDNLEFKLGKYHYTESAKGFYPYKNQLYRNSNQIKTFKYLEWYRFGVQFQHKTGKWSEPIYITDKRNTVPIKAPYTKEGFNVLPVAELETTISDDILKKLNTLGYIKMRPMVVYPKLSEREVIAQGMVCPTVYNVEDRASGNTTSQSSWFIRPTPPYEIVNDNAKEKEILEGKPSSRYSDGSYLEFRNNYPIPSNNKKNAEIQVIYNPEFPYVVDVQEAITHPDKSREKVNKWVADKRSNFYVDQSIFTFHSPEIEFDTDIQNIDMTNLKFRIVGFVPFTSFNGNIDINTSTPKVDKAGLLSMYPDFKGDVNTFIDSIGLYNPNISKPNISQEGFKSLVSGYFWVDYLYGNYKGNSHILPFLVGYKIYPFHKTKSIVGQKVSFEKTNTIHSILDTKRLSNLKYSFNSYYLNNDSIWLADKDDNDNTGISGIGVFNSNEDTILRLPKQEYSQLDDIIYKGNVSKLLLANRYDKDELGYPIIINSNVNKEDTSLENLYSIFNIDDNHISSSIDTIKEYMKKAYYIYNSIGYKFPYELADNLPTISNDPVSMKYKSTPHAVLALNYTKSGWQRVLPTLYGGSSNTNRYPINTQSASVKGSDVFWGKGNNFTAIQDVIDVNLSEVNNNPASIGPEFGWLWLGEIYNDNVKNRFGGVTEEAFTNNEWLPCGDAIDIKDNVTITWNGGDTYYQRYDHIKTYPFTLKDENCITEVVSFMCETRVNIDGRYDRNRGKLNNFATTPENFNILNPVYTQSDNFFTYRGIDYSRFNLDYFPITITWTLEKTLGDIVDKWTTITMSSVLDLDGDKGQITSLNTFSNEIFAFQETAISNIMFNSRVQIPTSDGVPIEISNNNKVGGKRYISNLIGCFNKWSIVETLSGLYFIDDITKGIYLFNGQLINLSEKLGFNSWIKNNSNLEVWQPEDFNNFISFYDKDHKDVYFINKNTCLVYSEILQVFTSFMDYNKVSDMLNINNDFVSIKGNKLWLQNKGEYNNFFGEIKPFYVTYRVGDISGVDKTFTNVEFRADTYDDKELLHFKTFDTLTVWNEYQEGKLDLTKLFTKPSPLKKKFRIWRADIPRDSKSKYKMQRIRNPWAYIKLSMDNPDTTKTELHDFKVTYLD